MSPWTVVFLAGAGVLAGIFGSVGGLASLASYPALLLAGLPPTAANVTNSVALVATTVGAAAGSGPELRGQGRRIGRLSVVSAVGGTAGAILLLTLPPGVFELVVPWLIAGASVVLLLGPRLRRPTDGDHRHASVGVFFIAVYSGYFGAAAGVLMLALLSAISTQSLARTNAAKTLITGASNAVAAVIFAVGGPVHWVAALALAAGSLAGGWLGPAVVRRLPERPLRIGIACAGLVLAAKLAVDAFRSGSWG
ncbi:sulfite exporter TauE/SafE family protein [Actinoplanes friuliensis]|uniref:sulfite exporter TauE/SafE family protein n=1 Tax=Actinoplanes friuliensis TaxID=196914 RepID=UPI00042472FC|nr:sulfite exporter TauE/SafE family protein [Actinoplanes friuliensis]